MEGFAVHKGLQVYKALVNVLSKGRFILTNIFQAAFMHYPKQQQCIIDLLKQLEDNGLMPDYEMEDILLNIFGERGHPLRKFWRIMFWVPKFKNLSPWSLPDHLLDDIKTSEIPDSIENTWVVSAHLPTQNVLLNRRDLESLFYVEGAFKICVKNQCVNYFILRANTKLIIMTDKEDLDDISIIEGPLFNISSLKEKYLMVAPTVHEQEDGVIFSICATGTSGQDSLLSWIRHFAWQ